MRRGFFLLSTPSDGYGRVRREKQIPISNAENSGSGWVSVRSSNHFGAVAFYALHVVERGMIGFATTNAGPTMAPSGGREVKLGDNALALAIPAGRHPPIVLDMATGAVAWGKIFVAQQEKKKIPTTWALDQLGVPPPSRDTGENDHAFGDATKGGAYLC